MHTRRLFLLPLLATLTAHTEIFSADQKGNPPKDGFIEIYFNNELDPTGNLTAYSVLIDTKVTLAKFFEESFKFLEKIGNKSVVSKLPDNEPLNKKIDQLAQTLEKKVKIGDDGVPDIVYVVEKVGVKNNTTDNQSAVFLKESLINWKKANQGVTQTEILNTSIGAIFGATISGTSPKKGDALVISPDEIEKVIETNNEKEVDMKKCLYIPAKGKAVSWAEFLKNEKANNNDTNTDNNKNDNKTKNDNKNTTTNKNNNNDKTKDNDKDKKDGLSVFTIGALGLVVLSLAGGGDLVTE